MKKPTFKDYILGEFGHFFANFSHVIFREKSFAQRSFVFAKNAKNCAALLSTHLLQIFNKLQESRGGLQKVTSESYKRCGMGESTSFSPLRQFIHKKFCQVLKKKRKNNYQLIMNEQR